VVSALPPISQSPLSTSSTTHHVALRMFSPSIETMASVSLRIIWRFCSWDYVPDDANLNEHWLAVHAHALEKADAA
jgi:hypothetical protein